MHAEREHSHGYHAQFHLSENPKGWATTMMRAPGGTKRLLTCVVPASITTTFAFDSLRARALKLRSAILSWAHREDR